MIWRLRYLADGSLMGACGGTSGGLLLFWKSGADKDYHRLALPNIARDMDLHPDGLRVATAHHDGNGADNATRPRDRLNPWIPQTLTRIRHDPSGFRVVYFIRYA